MVNPAGKARWCGQTIDDRSRIRPGIPGVLASKPGQGDERHGLRKFTHLAKAIRIRPDPPSVASKPSGDSPYLS